MLRDDGDSINLDTKQFVDLQRSVSALRSKIHNAREEENSEMLINSVS